MSAARSIHPASALAALLLCAGSWPAWAAGTPHPDLSGFWSLTRERADALRKLRDEGASLLFVSHKLEEVLDLCDDVTVLRVAHAYESATPWRARRPELNPNAVFSAEQPLIPDPEQASIGQKRRDEIAALVQRAGLTLNERHFEQLCATAPYIDEMTGRLERDPAFHDEPSNIFIA